MQTPLPTQKRFLLLGILGIGTIFGIIIISPNINDDKFLGGFAGFMISYLLCHLIFPELRERSRGVWNGNNAWGFNMKRYFTHPTQKPLMLGLLWFGAFFLVMALLVLFDLKITPETNILLLVWLLPCCLLFGLSGFLILRRNEYVNQFGKLTSGFWARFNGILGIVFGWGSAILIIIIVVFDLK